MSKECNDCGKCPYFNQIYDYWGECDEWCEVGLKAYRHDCKYSKLTLKILYIIKKITDKYIDWRIDKQIQKDMEAEYKERVKLEMTEEEYEQYVYEQSIKNS